MQLQEIRLKPWQVYGYFLITLILLLLPGNEFPSTNISIPHLDKVIHFIIFGGFVIAVCNLIIQKTSDATKWHRLFLLVLFVAIDYGIIIEFIQKYFVPFRSFDVWDIVADAVGSIAGWLTSRKLYIKN